MTDQDFIQIATKFKSIITIPNDYSNESKLIGITKDLIPKKGEFQTLFWVAIKTNTFQNVINLKSIKAIKSQVNTFIVKNNIKNCSSSKVIWLAQYINDLITHQQFLDNLKSDHSKGKCLKIQKKYILLAIGGLTLLTFLIIMLIPKFNQPDPLPPSPLPPRPIGGGGTTNDTGQVGPLPPKPPLPPELEAEAKISIPTDITSNIQSLENLLNSITSSNYSSKQIQALGDKMNAKFPSPPNLIIMDKGTPMNMGDFSMKDLVNKISIQKYAINVVSLERLDKQIVLNLKLTHKDF